MTADTRRQRGGVVVAERRVAPARDVIVTALPQLERAVTLCVRNAQTRGDEKGNTGILVTHSVFFFLKKTK